MEGFYEYVRGIWDSPVPGQLARAILVAAAFELLVYVTGVMIRRAVAPALRRGGRPGREPSERIRRRRIVEGVPLAFNRAAWYAIALLMVLRILGLPTQAELLPVLALAVIAALVVGKNVLRDAVHGYLIAYDNVYAPGDTVTVGQVSGVVTDISLRTTRVRTGEGHEMIIPNSQIALVANNSRDASESEPE